MEKIVNVSIQAQMTRFSGLKMVRTPILVCVATIILGRWGAINAQVVVAVHHALLVKIIQQYRVLLGLLGVVMAARVCKLVLETRMETHYAQFTRKPSTRTNVNQM
jgi:hypothetical protein